MGKTLQAPRRRGFSPSNDQPALAADRAVATVASEPAVPARRPRPRPREPAAGIPGVVAERALPSPVTVSVICPTFNRAAMHEKLYENFRKQDYAAQGFSGSSTIRMRHRPSSEVHGPGRSLRHTPQKRRSAPSATSSSPIRPGALIAHFDDDDYTRRTTSLRWSPPSPQGRGLRRTRHVERVSQRDGHRRLFDARRQMHANMWGWGFSYIYRRYVATLVRFPNLNNGEDYAFVQAVARASGLKPSRSKAGAD